MNAQSLQIIHSSIAAMPVAAVFSQQLLQHQNSPVAAQASPPQENEEKLILRATRVTTVLSSIHGYEHYGLND